MRNNDFWNSLHENTSSGARHEKLRKIAALASSDKDALVLWIKNHKWMIFALILMIAVSFSTWYAITCSWTKTEDGVIYGFKNGRYSAIGAEEGVERIVIKSKVGNKKITAIANEAFISNQSLKEVVIEDGIKYIGKNTSLHNLDDGAFAYCYNLEKIVFPSTLKKISKCAFYGCKNLKEIYLPEGFKKIGARAFENCRGIEKISLPASLKRMGSNAFDNPGAFNSLESIDYRGTREQWKRIKGSELIKAPVNCKDGIYQ